MTYNNEFRNFRELAKKNRLLFSKHFSEVRQHERNITNEELKQTIIKGFIFEEDDAYKAVYKIGNEYVSVVFNFAKSRKQIFIITAYNPKNNSWDVDSYKRWLKQGKR